MSRVAIILALLLSVAGCDGAASAGSSPAYRTTGAAAAVPPTPSTTEPPPSATRTTPALAPSAPERPPPVHVAPRTLATSWPTYLGRQVSFACRPVRRIDLLRTLIVGDGARFVVTSAPDMTPCSARVSSFTVTGSTIVSLGGRVALPELLLVNDDECER